MSKLKLPKKIKIGARTYRIKPWSRADADLADKYGHCDNSLAVICVCDQYDPAQVLDTLWHEIKHAIWERLAIDEVETEDWTEEHIVRATATAEVEVLLDNPELVYLFQEGGDGE